MKIKEMKTLDFQGLPGTRTFRFGKINCYCTRQGAGKTSVLNALRYALSGQEPEGSAVYLGASRCAVSLETEHASVIRQKFASGGGGAFLDRKKSTRQAVDNAISTESGVPVKTTKVLSSGDIIRALRPAEFGELIRGYMPEMLDTPRILGYLPPHTPEADEFIREHLPQGEFGIPAISDFYKTVTDERRVLKKEISSMEAVAASNRKLPRPEKSLHELKGDEERLLVLLKDEQSFEKAEKAYRAAVANAEAHRKRILELRERIAKIPAKERPESERAAAADRLARRRRECDAAKKAATAFSLNASRSRKMLEGLSTALCPLSDRLVCTTDKTPIRRELADMLRDAEKGAEIQNEAVRMMEEEIRGLERDIAAFDAEKRELLLKRQLEEELASREKVTIAVPEKPARPDAGRTAKLLEDVRAALRAAEAHAYADEREKELDGMKKHLRMLEGLAKAFEPKGTVMAAITEEYTGAFEDILNEKAAALNPGMKVRLETGNGVQAFVDVHGDGRYLDYASLSGGERALYIFLILDLLNSLSGLRILFLDELSVLDADTFDALITLVLDRLDEYDHVFIATVEHSDTLETLKKHGIALSEIPRPEPPAVES